jgi:hypothetical protein
MLRTAQLPLWSSTYYASHSIATRDHSAVDNDFRSRDEASLVRGEEKAALAAHAVTSTIPVAQFEDAD